jgi:hypothetical protein
MDQLSRNRTREGSFQQIVKAQTADTPVMTENGETRTFLSFKNEGPGLLYLVFGQTGNAKQDGTTLASGERLTFGNGPLEIPQGRVTANADADTVVSVIVVRVVR